MAVMVAICVPVVLCCVCAESADEEEAEKKGGAEACAGAGEEGDADGASSSSYSSLGEFVSDLLSSSIVGDMPPYGASPFRVIFLLLDFHDFRDFFALLINSYHFYTISIHMLAYSQHTA